MTIIDNSGGYRTCESYWIVRYRTNSQLKLDYEKKRRTISKKIFEEDDLLKIKLNTLIHRFYLRNFEQYDSLYQHLKLNNIVDIDDFFYFVLSNYKNEFNLNLQYYISPQFFMRKMFLLEYKKKQLEDILYKHDNQLFYSTIRNIIQVCKKTDHSLELLLDKIKIHKQKVFGGIIKNKLSITFILGISQSSDLDLLPKDISKEIENKFNITPQKLFSHSKILVEKRFGSVDRMIKKIYENITKEM